MEDAYTIGIRLALDDGVSAGIAAISGDLAALDRAVAGSAMGLDRLRAFSSGVGVSAAADMQRVARQGGQVMQPLAPPLEEKVPATSARADAMTVPSQAAPVTIAVTPPTAAPAMRSLAPMLLPAAPSLPDFAAFAPGPSAPTQPDTAPTAAAAPTIVRVIEHHRQLVTHEIGRSLVPHSADPPNVSPSGIPVAPLRTIVPPLSVPVPETGGVSLAPAAPPAMVAATMAPTSVTAPTSGAPIAVPPPAMTTRQSATPLLPAAQVAAGPSQGDVFLDGLRIGRWVTDALTREAARPSAGSTPFDPRMGPSWPGTQQGF